MVLYLVTSVLENMATLANHLLQRKLNRLLLNQIILFGYILYVFFKCWLRDDIFLYSSSLKGSMGAQFWSVDNNCAYLEGFYHQMTIRWQLKTTVDMARSVIIKISRIVIVMLWILRRSCAVRREWRPTAQIIFPVSTSGQGEEAIVIITAITYIFSVTYTLHFF